MSIIKKAKEELLKDLEDKKLQIVKSNLVRIKLLRHQIDELEKLNLSIEEGGKDEEYLRGKHCVDGDRVSHTGLGISI